MKIFKLNTVGIICDIKEHKSIKNDLLDIISKTPSENINDDVNKIDNLDWSKSRTFEKEYFTYLWKHIEPYFKDIAHNLRAKKLEIGDCWFQQYIPGDIHDWHLHPKTTWQAVYYLEMNGEQLETEVWDIYEQRPVKTTVKEGELFVFPGNIIHRAPKNNSKNRKTVITFNLDFDYPDLTKLNF